MKQRNNLIVTFVLVVNVLFCSGVYSQVACVNDEQLAKFDERVMELNIDSIKLAQTQKRSTRTTYEVKALIAHSSWNSSEMIFLSPKDSKSNASFVFKTDQFFISSAEQPQNKKIEFDLPTFASAFDQIPFEAEKPVLSIQIIKTSIEKIKYGSDDVNLSDDNDRWLPPMQLARPIFSRKEVCDLLKAASEKGVKQSTVVSRKVMIRSSDFTDATIATYVMNNFEGIEITLRLTVKQRMN